MDKKQNPEASNKKVKSAGRSPRSRVKPEENVKTPRRKPTVTRTRKKSIPPAPKAQAPVETLPEATLSTNTATPPPVEPVEAAPAPKKKGSLKKRLKKLKSKIKGLRARLKRALKNGKKKKAKTLKQQLLSVREERKGLKGDYKALTEKQEKG